MLHVIVVSLCVGVIVLVNMSFLIICLDNIPGKKSTQNVEVIQITSLLASYSTFNFSPLYVLIWSAPADSNSNVLY